MRIATKNDLDLIRGMSERFGKESNMPVNLDDAMESIENYMDFDNCVVCITEGGMAAAMVAPAFFNKRILIAQELFWWVDKEYRNKGVGHMLLKELEKWALEKGAKALVMIALMSSFPEKVEKMYINDGYVPFERSFIKYL